MPKLDRLALAQLTVNYKLTTMERTVGKDKSSGKMAGAKLSAYLETTDGDLQIWATDVRGDRTERLNTVPDYDPRKRPWYRAAAEPSRHRDQLPRRRHFPCGVPSTHGPAC